MTAVLSGESFRLWVIRSQNPSTTSTDLQFISPGDERAGLESGSPSPTKRDGRCSRAQGSIDRMDHGANWMTVEPNKSGPGVTLVGVLVLVLVVSVSCSGAWNSSPGKIELGTEAFDFGTISNTDPVTETLVVRNVGSGSLEILGVSTSCACTTAVVDSRHLAPGRETGLTVTYDPRVHDGTTGEFMRIIYVRSDDPNTPEASVAIWVTVVEPLDLDQSGTTSSEDEPALMSSEGGTVTATPVDPDSGGTDLTATGSRPATPLFWGSRQAMSKRWRGTGSGANARRGP